MSDVGLYAGSLSNLTGSMAQAIEEAFAQLLQEAGLPALPADIYRQVLFIAISRGVINHLEAREEALDVGWLGHVTVHVGTQ